MADRVAVHRFVDRCQTAILEYEQQPIELVRRLEESARHFAQAMHELPTSERPLARTAIGRVLRLAVVKQGLSADSELASSLTTFLASDPLDTDCGPIFKRWLDVLGPSASTERLDSRIGRALTFIRRSYKSRGLSLRRTAKVAGVSPWHLARMLRKCTGSTYVTHVRLMRVEAAGSLLRSSSLPMKQIAAAVGYANHRELDRDFRRIHNLSPSTYRRARTDTK